MKKWLSIIFSIIVLIILGVVLYFNFIQEEENPNNESNIESSADISSSIETESDEQSKPDVPKHTVRFYSNDGSVIKIDKVREGATAIPPNISAMTYGTIFKSWNEDFANVTRDIPVYPICEDIKNKENVIAISGVYGIKGQTICVPVQLCGDVCVSGMDITIRYDSELLKLESISEDKYVVVNDKTPGAIKLNYVSIQNTIADVDLCNLYFQIIADNGIVPLELEMNEICAFDERESSEEYSLITPKFNIIEGNVFVIKQ